jgi:hypothetical protein
MILRAHRSRTENCLSRSMIFTLLFATRRTQAASKVHYSSTAASVNQCHSFQVENAALARLRTDISTIVQFPLA